MKKSWRPARVEVTRDTSLEVVEPTQSTEFEVQSVLWHGLRAKGINARGEVKCAFSGRAQVRFDIAVFDDGKLVGVIECKRDGKAAGWAATRQGKRYTQFGVPVRLVRGMEDAARALADAEKGQLWGSG